MDVEYNVTGKIFVENAGDFLKGIKTAPFQLVGSLQNGEKLECEFKFELFSYSLRFPQGALNGNLTDGFCVEVRLKNMIVKDSGLYAAEMMDATSMKNVCKFLSETFNGEVSMGKCSDVYGNCNVFNGGSDYDVIEEKWITCAYDKGNLVEEKSFSK